MTRVAVLVTTARELSPRGGGTIALEPSGEVIEQHLKTLQAGGVEVLVVATDSEPRAFGRHAEPRSLSSLSATDLDGIDALLVPDLRGDLMGLADNAHLGRLLGALLAKRSPIATVGHGGAALLSVPERPDGVWLLDGYRMVCTLDEEDQADVGERDASWSLDVALRGAGGVFDAGAAGASHVVVDRNLVTGQNPASSQAVVGVLLSMLAPARTARPQAEFEAITTGTAAPDSRSAPATVEEFLDGLGRHDLGAVLRCLDPRLSVTVHPLGVVDGDVQALRVLLTEFLHAFPDLRISVGQLITTGEVVTALLRARGTQAAPYLGAVNRGKLLEIDQAWRCVVVKGLITEVTAYWCQAQLLRRLGVRHYGEVAIA